MVRPFWRRVLIVGGLVVSVAIVGVLAFTTYAILSEDEDEPKAQVGQPTLTATPRPSPTPVATPTPSPPSPTATPTPEPTPEPIVEEQPPPPPPTDEPPPPTEEPPVPTEPPLAPPPTEEPEAICEPGYVLAAPGVCCPSDSPVLVWGEVCVAEGYGDYPTLAIDQVTFWFFALMGLVPSPLDIAINRQVCSASPDLARYWRVKCTDTGGEYLVAHDGTDVQPANDIALALVVAILTSPAGQTIVETCIDGEFTGWSGDTAFELCNGQLWIQASYAYLYHYAYRPAVTIVSTDQGYRLFVEGVSDSILVVQVTDFIRTCIDGDFEGWEGETIFVLCNGQVWQQAGYDYMYHYAYRPEVLIYRTDSRYRMKVERVRQTIDVIRLQ